jgi:hypothetical protein
MIFRSQHLAPQHSRRDVPQRGRCGRSSRGYRCINICAATPTLGHNQAGQLREARLITARRADRRAIRSLPSRGRNSANGPEQYSDRPQSADAGPVIINLFRRPARDGPARPGAGTRGALRLCGASFRLVCRPSPPRVQALPASGADPATQLARPSERHARRRPDALMGQPHQRPRSWQRPAASPESHGPSNVGSFEYSLAVNS